MVEQSPGVNPPAFGRGFGDAQNIGSFMDFKAGKIAEFDQISLFGLQSGKAFQGIVEGEQLIIRGGAGDFKRVGIERPDASS